MNLFDIPIGAEVEFKIEGGGVMTGKIIGRGLASDGPFYEVECPDGLGGRIRMDLVRQPGGPWPEEWGGPPPEESPSCRTS